MPAPVNAPGALAVEFASNMPELDPDYVYRITSNVSEVTLRSVDSRSHSLFRAILVGVLNKMHC